MPTVPKFQLQKRRGSFYFTLMDNGQVILMSGTYKSKANAQTGIASVRKNSELPTRLEKICSKGGFCFVLRAANEAIIGCSEIYLKEKDCDETMVTLMRVGGDAIIEDLTNSRHPHHKTRPQLPAKSPALDQA